jgi:hypothetical protein
MIPWHAILTFHKLLLTAILLSIAYGFVIRRLAEFMQGYRLRLAQEGEEYIIRCRTQTERAQIRFYLDNALNPWLMIWTAVLLPSIMAMQLFKPENPDFEMTDPGTHNEIACLFLFSALAANPLFALIVLLEIVAVFFPSIVLAGNAALIKRAVKVFLRREAGGHHFQRASI